jgi:UTP--glucose-1-phosphate uridylyltransferase
MPGERRRSNSFAPFADKMRAARIPPIAIENFRHYYELLSSGHTGDLSNREIEPVADLPAASELIRYRSHGIAALARAVVIKLNGGLGTSMGMTHTKSLLEVKSGLTFLDIIVQQILRAREQHGCRLPLVLMDSFHTQAETLAALERFPELATDLPLDFLQHKVPKVRAEDLAPVAWPQEPELEWCPPGHGDIYAALQTSGLLERLLAADIEFAFVSNSDNLGAVLDLDILGWLAAERLPLVMEVADRTEADRKGGHLARFKDGRLVLREVAQCPAEEIDSFRDISLYRYFNTNSLWLNLKTLAEVLAERGGVLGLPMIRNEKTVDPADASSPAVYQLETAMGAAISVFEGAQAVRVSRERFLPVKTTNDLLVAWSDAYRLTEDLRFVPARGNVGELVVDLDPPHYKRIDQLEKRFPHGAPSLRDCQRLEIRGDVRFGRGVVCRGEVRIEQTGRKPRVIPDGEVLD